MTTLKEWAEAHGVTFVGRSAGVYTAGAVAAGALEELFAELDALRRERDDLAARLAKVEQAEPVAWVPMHPRQGALWAMTTATPSEERLPSHYPLSPLYASSAPAAAPEQADNVAAEVEQWKRIAENAQAVTTGGDDKGDYFEVPSHLIAALALALDEGLGAQGQAGGEAANPAGGCGACGDSCRQRGSCRLADESPKPADPRTPPPGCRLLALARPCRCGPDGCSDSTSCPRGER